MEKEVWKSIKGFDNYLVSNHGRIFSVKRKILCKHKSTFYYRKWPSKMLRLGDHKDGYPLVKLVDSNRRICPRKVHRLVTIHFVRNLNPEKYNVVNHLDSDPKNNHYSNLEWTDAIGNMKHCIAMGRNTPALGEINGNSKLTSNQVQEIREKRNFSRLKDLAIEYNVSVSVISQICNLKTWKHV